jgi:tetratricopeptide (TPR) repeat protein
MILREEGLLITESVSFTALQDRREYTLLENLIWDQIDNTNLENEKAICNYELATIFSHQWLFSKAIDNLDKAISLSESASYYLKLGIALFFEGKLEEASGIFNEMIKKELPVSFLSQEVKVMIDCLYLTRNFRTILTIYDSLSTSNQERIGYYGIDDLISMKN